MCSENSQTISTFLIISLLVCSVAFHAYNLSGMIVVHMELELNLLAVKVVKLGVLGPTSPGSVVNDQDPDRSPLPEPELSSALPEVPFLSVSG